MTCCEAPPVKEVLVPATLSGNIEEDTLLASSRQIETELFQSEFIIPNMHCVGCIRKLERGVGALPFVSHVRANLSLKKLTVVWRAAPGNILKIDRAISETGYDHSVFDLTERDEGEKSASNRLLLALAVAGFAALNIMLLSVSVWAGADMETTRLFHLISGVIAVPAVFYCGQPFFRSAIGALKVGRMNMDVPISLAVLLALLMSLYESLTGGEEAYFDAAVTLLFFLLIGRYLDNLMREKARSSIVQLSRLSAKGATLVGKGGELSFLKLDEIEPAMVVRVMAGERVPVDGEVVKGQSDVDFSLVTGESVPQLVSVSSKIEAGTLNLTGAIDIKVLRDADNSFLAEVTRMMEAADKGRGTYTRIADKMAQIYAPAVHLLAAMAFIGWMIFTGGEWHTSIYVAISVLIITCPCALGLAVPVVHVVAARQLFAQGIYIRDGSGFERLEQVDHVLFDKTGTLTGALPKLKSVELKSAEDQSIAKALASHSSHPFSVAVAAFIKGAPSNKIIQIREIAGAGVEGVIEGKPVRLGRYKWVADIAEPVSDIDPNSRQLWFAIAGGQITGFELREELREGAVVAVDKLTAGGLGLEIISGDGAGPLKKVADELAITSYFDSAKPADKIAHIEKLKQDGRKVLMVGDGLNDSPALRAADVSMAPASASDIARHAADFIFTRQNLGAVPFAMKIAKRSGILVRQNFALAIAYNSIAIPFAIAGAITPLIAAIAMSASSIVVVANSMRLNFATNDDQSEMQNSEPDTASSDRARSTSVVGLDTSIKERRA